MKHRMTLVSIALLLIVISAACQPLGRSVPETPTMVMPSDTPSPLPPTETATTEPTATVTPTETPEPTATPSLTAIWPTSLDPRDPPDYWVEYELMTWQEDLSYGIPILRHKDIPDCFLRRLPPQFATEGTAFGGSITRIENSKFVFDDRSFTVVRLYYGERLGTIFYWDNHEYPLGANFWVGSTTNIEDTCIRDAEKVLTTSHAFPTATPAMTETR